MKFLVAVDSSDNALEAFNTTLKLTTPRSKGGNDEIILFSVAERDIVWLGVLECNSSLVDRAHRLEDKGVKSLLAGFAVRCAQVEVQHKLVMSQGGNVGETVCQACTKYSPDCLVIGRRGLSSAKRLIYGSTSRYCVDNAPCSVLVVKSSHISSRELHQNIYISASEELVSSEMEKIEVFTPYNQPSLISPLHCVN